MGGLGFKQLTHVEMRGYYHAQHVPDGKPFLAYVLQVHTLTSPFLIYRRYSQIASLSAKLHFQSSVGLPPKYALQVFPLTQAQLQQRYDGLARFMQELVTYLTQQYTDGKHHDTRSSAGHDMQMFTDFVLHHENRPPRPVNNNALPTWAQPPPLDTTTTTWADNESLSESDEVLEQHIHNNDNNDDDTFVSTSFENEVLQVERNVSALWHCIRAYVLATTTYWEATTAVLTEYKRFTETSLYAHGDQNIEKETIDIVATCDTLARALASFAPTQANSCFEQILRPLETLRQDVLPDLQETFWTRRDTLTPSVRRMHHERANINIQVRHKVHESLDAFVALQTAHFPIESPHGTDTGMPEPSVHRTGSFESLPVSLVHATHQNLAETVETHDVKNTCKVYLWGRVPSQETPCSLIVRPQSITIETGQPIVQVACGGEHLLYLTSTGDVYSYGESDDTTLNTFIQSPPSSSSPLPLPTTTFCTPRLVQALALEKALHQTRIVSIACGAHHSIAITHTGQVFTWGRGEDGRLGHGDVRDRIVPRKVMTLLSERVLEASCGGAHTAVVTAVGTVYTFGRGRHGRLGLGDLKWRATPHEIQTFPVCTRICRVVCGWNFTAAIDDQGRVFTWGKTGEGQCGIGYVTDDQVVPRALGGLDDGAVVDVACGYTHTLAVTVTGVVYSWGLGEYGQLGTGNVYQPVPCRVPMMWPRSCPRWDPVYRVNCGAFHSFATSKARVVFAWGLNAYGACGLGDTLNRDTPERVDAFAPDCDRVLACGHKYTVAIERPNVLASLNDTATTPEPVVQEDMQEKEEELRRIKKLWRTRVLRGWETNRATPLAHALWRQGIPPSIRAQVWPLAIGNKLKVTPEMFHIYRRRAAAYKRTIATPLDGGREHTVALIDTDLPRTFPTFKLFDASGPYYAFLQELLETYAWYRPDLGYIQGMSYLAAMLCLHMPQDRYLAFQCLANLLVNEHLFTFYLLDVDLARVYYTLFDAFLQTRNARLLTHFRAIGIHSCSMYLMNWLQTLFLQVLPLETAARVFDNFLLDGTVFLFRTAMAIHELLAPQLLEADMEGVLPLLQHNIMFHDTWHQHVSEQALFATIATIAVPSEIYAALDRVVNDVFFYEKRSELDSEGSAHLMALASGGQSVGIGRVKNERRRMYAISDTLNGVLGGF
ncbi:hypothetical protein CCR75_008957 [Bremia lactucae]|uniref:Rab-GAP TBC domain-containing protein n=1 Tax=Bremia lactucae TaxID=4779 RepID=A0A976FMV6_BRELC|nr:hypothetical protein CCR75_008957 [Bremia lactucae]